jgi:hypothetical protein
VTIKTLRASPNIASFKHALRMRSLSTAPTAAIAPGSNLAQISNMDITALAMLVMMEAAQDAQSDLSSLLEQMQKVQLERSQERQISKIVGEVTRSLNSPSWRRPHAR